MCPIRTDFVVSMGWWADGLMYIILIILDFTHDLNFSNLRDRIYNMCWKFQSMLKSVMHVESILKKSVENYKKTCWNFQHVLKTVKKHVEISVCSENCKKACWKFQNVLKTVMHVVCLKFQRMLKTVMHVQNYVEYFRVCWKHVENFKACWKL